MKEDFLRWQIQLFKGMELHSFLACVRRIYVDTATPVNVTSPGYPRAYPSNIVCVWHVTSPPRATLLLTYLDFRLQDTPFCSNDYVIFSYQFYPQPECSTPHVPVTKEINSNNFTVKFVTDNDVDNPGFFLHLSVKVVNGISVILLIQLTKLC